MWYLKYLDFLHFAAEHSNLSHCPTEQEIMNLDLGPDHKHFPRHGDLEVQVGLLKHLWLRNTVFLIENH